MFLRRSVSSVTPPLGWREKLSPVREVPPTIAAGSDLDGISLPSNSSSSSCPSTPTNLTMVGCHPLSRLQKKLIRPRFYCPAKLRVFKIRKVLIRSVLYVIGCCMMLFSDLSCWMWFVGIFFTVIWMELISVQKLGNSVIGHNESRLCSFKVTLVVWYVVLLPYWPCCVFKLPYAMF